jgi:uncharacterized repeat protein (TIGR01451 family)
MNEFPSLPIRTGPSRAIHLAGVSTMALAMAIGSVTPAFATIDNTATPSGTYNALPVPTVNSSTVNIPVTPAAPTLTVVKSAGVPVDTNADGIISAGDKITYTYTVTNTGNVTINAAKPVDAGPTFNQIAGTGTMGAFSPLSQNLTPIGGGTSSQVFTAVYTLSALDADRAAGIPKNAVGDASHAVENSATATGTPVIGVLGAVTASLAETQIPGNAALSINKTWAFFTPGGDANSNGKADVGDKIVYTYTVINTGNVTATAVTVADTHEGALLPAGTVANETMAVGDDGPLAPGTVSTDAANNGSWDVLRPGARITFTYTHTVTQTEVNGG